MSNILIVDDDPSFLDATRRLMEHEGHKVACVSSGKNGYQAALSQGPDLMILDVMMESVLEGVEVSRKMHGNPVTSGIPILMVSGITRTEFADLLPEGGEINKASYLTKPVDPTLFVKKVRRILA